MQAELEPLAAERGPLHSSRKTSDSGFASLDFEQASIANHGYTFHDTFIEPFCRKVTGLDTSVLSALYHRLAWAPLFYPETLLDALRGVPTSLPATTFSYPASGSLASMVHAIDAALRQRAGDRIVLKPENPTMPPIVVDPAQRRVQILGKVIGLLRLGGGLDGPLPPARRA